jgi:hypothetical protein
MAVAGSGTCRGADAEVNIALEGFLRQQHARRGELDLKHLQDDGPYF